MRWRNLVCLLFVAGLPSFVDAQVESFDESFSGAGFHSSLGGTHTGLDNSGWAIGDYGVEASADVAVTPDGLSVFADSEPIGGLIAGQRIERFITGQGSFDEQIDFTNLSLGNSPFSEDGFGSSASAGLSRRFAPGEVFPFVSVSLAEGPFTEGEDWQFAFSVRDSDGGSTHREIVPRGTNVSLSMSFDAAANEFKGSYDLDTLDPNNELIEIGFPRHFDFSENSLSRLTLSAEGQIAVSTTISGWKQMPRSEILGDLNGDAELDVTDLELLIDAFAVGDLEGDVSGDGQTDFGDVETWVRDLKGTYFGDANLDGEFDSADLVNVFMTAEYEDSVAGNSRWSTGDWNADFEFTTRDLVLAFGDGGYEQGPRLIARAVPEPFVSSMTPIAAGLTLVASLRRRRR